MLPTTPGCTLFPYTTLFRSLRPMTFCSAYLSRISRLSRRFSAENRRLKREMREDRKSTRLNSSHTVNSYAVLCLKKKIAKITHLAVESAKGNSNNELPDSNL